MNNIWFDLVTAAQKVVSYELAEAARLQTPLAAAGMLQVPAIDILRLALALQALDDQTDAQRPGNRYSCPVEERGSESGEKPALQSASSIEYPTCPTACSHDHSVGWKG